MTSLTGTWPLVRVAARRERIQLTVWIVILTVIVTALASYYTGLFETQEDIAEAARLFAGNPATRFLALPSEANIGSFIMLELYVLTSVLAGIMTILTVVRHTRQNEDEGRTELIGAGVVGRHAGLAAALIVAFSANGVLAALIAAGLIMQDLPVAGSIAAGAAIGAVGVASGAVAAITAQLWPTSRSASGFAAAALGAFFFLAGTGNALGTVGADGIYVASTWPAWLSPLGWGQHVRPYAGNHWWLFGLFAAFVVVTVGIAARLETHRDVGRGMIPERKGRAHAPRGLLSPFGLTWRLQRGLFIGWAIGVGISGLLFGALATDVESAFADISGGEELLTRLGGSDVILDAAMAAMMGMIGLAVAVYTVQTLMRMRSEETSGPLESVLATAVSRWRWSLAYVTTALIGTIGLLLVAGATFGLAAGIVLDDLPAWLGRIVGAGLAQAPAALVLGGLVVALFGLFPRRAVALSWAAYAIAFLLGPLIGAMFELPEWILNISPFTHTPAAPAVAVTAAPLVTLSAIAMAFGLLGILAFRRRDLALHAGS